MKFCAEMLRLYAVTDRAWLGGGTLAGQVEEAVRGGATCVQLREKHLDREAFLAEALALREVTRKAGVPLIINDDISICLESGADGVHVGQGDLPPEEARRLLGPGRILGVSARTVEQARAAAAAGADYLGVGAVFGTATKQDAQRISPERLREVCAAAPVPVVAIGGIREELVPQLFGCGAAGIAVVSALFAQPDITAAARRLRRLAGQL